MSQSNIPSKETSTNPYSVLQDDTSLSNGNNELDEILQSDNEQKLDTSAIISPAKSSDTTPIRQFKESFTKVTDAFDKLSTSKLSDTNTTEFIHDILMIYKHMLTTFDSTCEQLVQKHNLTFK